MPATKKCDSMREMYARYKGSLSYAMFCMILREYNQEILSHVINGDKISLNQLGDFYVKKIDRNYNRKVIDYAKSVRENGKLTKIVYFNDPFYLKFHWRKRNKIDENTRIFGLKIAKNNSALSPGRHLKKCNIDNPLLHLRYYQDLKYTFIEQRDLDGQLVRTFNNFETIKNLNPSFDINFIQTVVNNPSRSAYKHRWFTK